VHKLLYGDTCLPRRLPEALSAFTVQFHRDRHDRTGQSFCRRTALRTGRVVLEKFKDFLHDVARVGGRTLHINWGFFPKQPLWRKHKRARNRLCPGLKVIASLATNDYLASTIPNRRRMRPVILDIRQASGNIRSIHICRKAICCTEI